MPRGYEIARTVFLLGLLLLAAAAPATGQQAGTLNPGQAGIEFATVETPLATTWVTERADAPKIFEWMTARSLALDGAGYPHVAYGADRLYYAWFDGADWQYQVVDDVGSTGSGNVGRYASLALDATGQPQISYYDANIQGLKYARSAGTSWLITTVDSAGDVGKFSSLALDAAGQPHIAFYDASNRDLKYTYYDSLHSNGWHTETVDDAGEVGQYLALALDKAGLPHISYYDATAAVLKYAYLNGTSWQIMPVGSACGLYTSLAVDSAGRPHISYYETTAAVLQYAYHDGATWQFQTVDNTRGFYSSLALDAADRPHVSYCAHQPAIWSCSGLKYAHSTESGWQVETVEPGLQVGAYASLALDASEQAHISYYDSLRQELRYAYHDGAAWQYAVVDVAGNVGSHSSLEIDASAQLHISYYDAFHATLKYARYDGRLDQSRGWQIETVDPSRGVGKYSSLALDTAGRPHIGYYDAAHGDLKYAYSDGTTWFVETVDSSGDVGRYTSLALDASDRPHLSYCLYALGNACDDLRYAYFDGTAWQIETVDRAGYVGGYASLALDASDRPHLSYYDHTDYNLKYAWFDGSAWTIQVVDGTAWVGHFTSLALDTTGRPHIAYYDAANQDLKYAWQEVGPPAGPAEGVSWQVETVDSFGDVGRYTSLALDASGRPHLSYCRYYTNAYPNTCDDLLYAYHNGVDGWQIATIDSLGSVGEFNSLALDTSGQPHISYHDHTNRDLKVASRCTGVGAVGLAGPDRLVITEAGGYTATVTPPEATEPVLFAWDNGTSGPMAVYSWTDPGVYTVVVTATNKCGQTSGSVAVTVYCQEVEELDITGPSTLSVEETALYTVSYAPPTATQPILLTWDNGTVGTTAVYSWTLPGDYTIVITSTTPCGEKVGRWSVHVSGRTYPVYLPALYRSSASTFSVP